MPATQHALSVRVGLPMRTSGEKNTDSDQSNLPPDAASQSGNQLLPYVEQSNLKKPQPKQQGILPYVEHSNLRSRKARKRQ